jgi:SagB-type dehydrogenase family enzyme
MKAKIFKKIENNKEKFKISDSFHRSVRIFKFNKETKKNKPQAWVRIFYKIYPRLDKVVLSRPSSLVKNINLFELLLKRRSRRNFSRGSISLEQLSSILYYSAGVTQISDNKWEFALRSYPSAGARFPLEVYIAVNNVDGVKRGIYHYNLKDHCLELLRYGNYKKMFKKLTNQKMCGISAVNIIISAVFDRTRIKYGDRGYRFPFIEAGHMAQNFYLVSEALSLGCCTVGGFIDDYINNLLDFADSCEQTIYMISLGQIK